MDVEREIAFEKANRYGTIALVCLSIAITFFSVGVFSASPESVLGIMFLFVGIIAVLISYVCFALYGHYSKKH